MNGYLRRSALRGGGICEGGVAMGKGEISMRRRVLWTANSCALTVLVALGIAACSTSSSEANTSCGAIAPCYTVSTSVDPSSSEACKAIPTTARDTFDFNNIPAEGGSFAEDVAGAGTVTCKVSRPSCAIDLDCRSTAAPDVTIHVRYDFSATGFTGSNTTSGRGQTCVVNITGARSNACAPDAGIFIDSGPAPDTCGSCAGKECGTDDCGRSCGTCGKGFECSSSQCRIVPTSLWTMTIERGKIAPTRPDGAPWDSEVDQVDPYVCTYVKGLRQCTTAPADVFTPNWNLALPLTTAADLQLGFDAEIYDEDGTFDQEICARGLIPVTEQRLKSGAFTFGCPGFNGAETEVFVKLTPQ